MKSSTTANRLIEQAVLTNFFPDMENESLLLNDFELAFLQFGWTYGAVFFSSWGFLEVPPGNALLHV